MIRLFFLSTAFLIASDSDLIPPGANLVVPEVEIPSTTTSSTVVPPQPQALPLQLNAEGYPSTFRKYDPLGDGNCWMWALGISMEYCEMGPKYPSEAIYLAQKYHKSVKIWTDPKHQLSHNFTYIDPKDPTVTHLLFGRSTGGNPHYFLLVDPASANAAEEHARGERLATFKGYAFTAEQKKANAQKMLSQPDSWLFGRVPNMQSATSTSKTVDNSTAAAVAASPTASAEREFDRLRRGLYDDFDSVALELKQKYGDLADALMAKLFDNDKSAYVSLVT